LRDEEDVGKEKSTLVWEKRDDYKRLNFDLDLTLKVLDLPRGSLSNLTSLPFPRAYRTRRR
jgi:hypothetical protein